MPGSTTTCDTIVTRCQNKLRDTMTGSGAIWDPTTFDGSKWADAINDAQLDIYNDIIRYKAWDLCDMLFDSVDITMVVDQEDYDWGVAISGASKSYYAFVEAYWGDYRVRVLPRYRYWHLVTGRIQPSIIRPFMVFWGDEYFKLRPKPAETSTTFTFHFVKSLTELDATTEKPQLDERCIPLFYPKILARYWEARRRFELKIMYDNEDLRNPGEYQKLRKQILGPHKRYELKDLVTVDNA